MHKNITIQTSLLAKRISAFITASNNRYAKIVNIEVTSITGSTNTDLRNRINTLVVPTLLVAEIQTAGRGRAGRIWQTTATSTLTFSLAWPFQQPLHNLVGLPLALGVTLTEVLTIFGIESTLKWPNDILRNGNKLGGILIETVQKNIANITKIWSIIGIGLNLTTSQNLRNRINCAIADAPELDKQDRAKLLAYLLIAFSNALVKFETQGFTAFVTRWNQLHAYNGRIVKIINNNATIHEGIAIGVNNQGYLLINTFNNHIISITTGDVSLRLQDECNVTLN